jgi:hypothetical protein
VLRRAEQLGTALLLMRRILLPNAQLQNKDIGDPGFCLLALFTGAALRAILAVWKRIAQNAALQ